MSDSGEWMTRADVRILEYLREHDSGSPAEMMREGPIQYAPEHIARRCKVLALHQRVRHLGDGEYALAGDGDGDEDASEGGEGESSESSGGFVFGGGLGDEAGGG